MLENPIWIGRFCHKRTKELCSVRVNDTQNLPELTSLAEVIEDPFADPQGDAVSRACVAKAQRACSLSDLLSEHEPALPLRPGKIIGIGRNFAEHAKELNNEVPAQPLLFFKPSTSLLRDGDTLGLRPEVGKVDMEAELVVVIGRGGKMIDKAQAVSHVGGLVMGNDISARELQKSQPRWVRAKGTDGFAPLGQWIRVARELPPADLRVQGWMGETKVQDAAISNLVFDIPTLIANISETMTLEAGDLIFTGTPAGVSPLQSGLSTRVSAQGLCLAGVCTPVA